MASSTLSAVGNHLVFLSFCGKDTRQGFISHLYDALCAERVKTFIDNDLPKGDRIDKIFEVIKEEKIHIVVYSKNYSSSKWCLDELAEIMKCLKCSNDGECHVLPVFYKVNPSSDIRGANSMTDYHFRSHELELGKNSMMVAIWKAALLDLSRIAGWHFETGAESKLVKDVVRRVLSLLQKGSKHFFSSFEETWNRKTFDLKNTLNFVQPTITRVSSNGRPQPLSHTICQRVSRVFQRQRSGTSTVEHTDFPFEELAFATKDFSFENTIGEGSFGVVYRGELSDGREVAIKRGRMKVKFQEKESAFHTEFTFLSRVHHKNLVQLVGYCHEVEERLLVYAFMKNGSLHDHLHNKTNVEKRSSVLNSWKVRIKIALDASRGIEYLHNYPIIHCDIKSSNILLGENWTAGVSNFGPSLASPDDSSFGIVGTIGYINPEYFELNALTVKKDIYSFGLVLLELLTGKKPIFKNSGTPMHLIDYVVPTIRSGELVKVLDQRVGSPETIEVEMLELVAYTAVHCVNLEGKDRPTMADVVANLERAFACSEESHAW